MKLPDYLEQSRYEKKKAYMRSLWEGQSRGALAYNTVMLTDKPAPGYGLEADHIGQEFLQWSLYSTSQRSWGLDFAIPMIQPNSTLSGGGGVMATAFGAAYDREHNHTAPIIHSADKIESLNLHPTLNDGLIPQALDIISYVVEKTDGKVPVQMYNAGGPMDIA